MGIFILMSVVADREMNLIFEFAVKWQSYKQKRHRINCT